MDIDKAIQELRNGPVVLPGRRNVPHKCTKCEKPFLTQVPRSTKIVTAFRQCPGCGSIERIRAKPGGA